MRSVYISGPMRGKPGCNFAAFDAAASLGRDRGFHVVSPADMDRVNGINGGETEDCTGTFNPASSREFADRDLHVLVNLLKAENEDAIALLPGWEMSIGTRAELAVAMWVGLKVLDATTFLPLSVDLIGKQYKHPMPAEFQGCGCGSVINTVVGACAPRHPLPVSTCSDGTCIVGSDPALEEYAIKEIAEHYANTENA